MVEFYEAYADYADEALRLEELVRAAAAAVAYAGPLDFAAPWRRVSFFQAIAQASGIDLSVTREEDGLRAAIAERGLPVSTDAASWAQMADELLAKLVEPTLRAPTFVLDYPVELSPFAREHRSEPGLVERWEAFAGGIELANAFSELNDADAQRERPREADDRVPEVVVVRVLERERELFDLGLAEARRAHQPQRAAFVSQREDPGRSRLWRGHVAQLRQRHAGHGRPRVDVGRPPHREGQRPAGAK